MEYCNFDQALSHTIIFENNKQPIISFCSLSNIFMWFHSVAVECIWAGECPHFLWLLLRCSVDTKPLSSAYDFYLKLPILFMRVWNLLAKKFFFHLKWAPTLIQLIRLREREDDFAHPHVRINFFLLLQSKIRFIHKNRNEKRIRWNANHNLCSSTIASKTTKYNRN